MQTYFLVFLLLLLFLFGFWLGWYSSSGTKSQTIRLLDVFLYGPLLILAGIYHPIRWLSIVLILIGAATMGYNLKNYLYVQSQSI